MRENTLSDRQKIVPVVLSGGAGTRLWPLSREHYPKQLLPLAGPRTMIQETLARFADATRFAPPIVVSNEETRFTIAEQMSQVVSGARLVLEPLARNTAPAVAAAALLAGEDAPEAVLLVVPSDHVIADAAGF